MAQQSPFHSYRYVSPKPKEKVINGYRFVLHHDNHSREKRALVNNFEIYAFWGGIPATEDIIYWATKKIAR